MQICESASFPYIKINMPFFCCHLFFKDFLNPHNQQNGKQTFFDKQPSHPDLTSMVISLFCIFVEFSLKSLIPKLLREICKFAFRLLGNTFVSHKNDPLCFYLCLPVSIFSMDFLITPKLKEITHSAPGSIFQISVSLSR